jgi:hypothetical protein
MDDFIFIELLHNSFMQQFHISFTPLNLYTFYSSFYLAIQIHLQPPSIPSTLRALF